MDGFVSLHVTRGPKPSFRPLLMSFRMDMHGGHSPVLHMQGGLCGGRRAPNAGLPARVAFGLHRRVDHGRVHARLPTLQALYDAHEEVPSFSKLFLCLPALLLFWCTGSVLFWAAQHDNRCPTCRAVVISDPQAAAGSRLEFGPGVRMVDPPGPPPMAVHSQVSVAGDAARTHEPSPGGSTTRTPLGDSSGDGSTGSRPAESTWHGAPLPEAV